MNYSSVSSPGERINTSKIDFFNSWCQSSFEYQEDNEVLDGTLNTIEPGKGITLSLWDYRFNDDIAFEVDGDLKFIEFCYCLSGELRCCVNEVKEDLIMKRGKCNISYFPCPNGIMKFKKGDSSKILTIRIDLSRLNSFLDERYTSLCPDLFDITRGKNKFFFIENYYSIPMMMVIHQIINCPYSGDFEKLYLETKVMELIIHQLALEKEKSLEKRKKAELKKSDFEGIYNARDILIKRMQNPPSLVELAREAGLNDYKLKIGFRQLFGTTVFGYLHDYRMECARLLLEESRKNVAEVALFVGYANPSHFAFAFKKRFGVNPGIFLSESKKRKSHIN